MPIYHFIVDYSQETCEGNKSVILISQPTLEKAQKILSEHLKKRKSYTGSINSYNVKLDWIENVHWEQLVAIKLEN